MPKVTKSRQRLEDAIDSYLKEQRVSLFGRAFGLTDKRERAACTKFLADAFQDIKQRL